MVERIYAVAVDPALTVPVDKFQGLPFCFGANIHIVF